MRAPPSAAVGKDDVDVVRAAARLGANLDRRDPTGMTPLHYAAQLGRVDVARALVDAGADADARTYSTNIAPIWLAAYHGRLDVVEVLAACPKVKVNPNCNPERAGVIPSALKGSVSAARAARSEHHTDVADFIEAQAAARRPSPPPS